MMTPEQAAGLAPDASSLKAAEGLATARKWVSRQQSAALIWGECQGSGSQPYQTAVTLDDIAFHCSCPSRKFPCKHALALLLLFSRQRDAFSVAPPPDWVANWQAARAARAAKTATRSQQPVTDTAAQARRAARREEKIEEGLVAIERWLYDLVRQGLVTAQNQPYRYWEGMAARLVDAQAPGLARLVRELAGIPASGDGWPERLLRRLALLHLLVQGYAHLDSLPAERQADVRTAVGWSIKQEDVLAQPGTQDDWLVIGRRVAEGEGLRSQYSWLWGQQTGRPALILDFAYRGQALNTTWLPGTRFTGELVFYPGSVPLRAAVKNRSGDVTSIDDLPGCDTLVTAVTQFNYLVAHNPWLEQVAFPLAHITPVADNTGWYLQDTASHRLPFSPTFSQRWELLALSGGQPLTLVAEWDGASWLPLSAWADGRLVNLI